MIIIIVEVVIPNAQQLIQQTAVHLHVKIKIALQQVVKAVTIFIVEVIIKLFAKKILLITVAHMAINVQKIPLDG